MRGRNGAANLEGCPFESFDTDRRQKIYDRVEFRGHFLLRFSEPLTLEIRRELQPGVGNSQSHDGIEEHSAITTGGGLNEKLKPGVRATRHFGFVFALRTFKEIGAAHDEIEMVGWQGLEPWTNALKGHCSTN